jgi:hypothetical protein
MYLLEGLEMRPVNAKSQSQHVNVGHAHICHIMCTI